MPQPESASGVIRVFIVEDHPVMRKMLAEIVERVGGTSVTGVAGSAEEALLSIPASGADLVLVDLSLPGMSGVDLVRELRRVLPETACLMVSGHIELPYVVQALEAGARGYILKGRRADLSRAIPACARGATFLSAPVQERLDEVRE
jgi:DNA-binding NarL/FixJ family response regulator